MAKTRKVTVIERAADGQLVEKETAFDAARFIYQPRSCLLLPKARPLVVEVAELKGRLVVLEEGVLRDKTT